MRARPEDVVRSIPAALQLPDCSVNFERVMRGALSALQANVITPRHEDHRHVPDLLAIIDRAAISDRVKQQARSVMQRLAEAEARIHHSPIESVHLHEVGGDDALIDIVGVLAALENLQIDRVYVSPVPLARGWTKSHAWRAAVACARDVGVVGRRADSLCGRSGKGTGHAHGRGAAHIDRA